MKLGLTITTSRWEIGGNCLKKHDLAFCTHPTLAKVGWGNVFDAGWLSQTSRKAVQDSRCLPHLVGHPQKQEPMSGTCWLPDVVPGLALRTAQRNSIKGEVKKKHVSGGRSFSCFPAHLTVAQRWSMQANNRTSPRVDHFFTAENEKHRTDCPRAVNANSRLRLPCETQPLATASEKNVLRCTSLLLGGARRTPSLAKSSQ